MMVRTETLAVTKLELFFNEISVGPATGFIYRYGQHIALVSNWHVFSGVHPVTGKVRDPRGCIPNRVVFNINLANPDEGSVLLRPENIALADFDGKYIWWQHRGYEGPSGDRRVVDIAVLELNQLIPDFDQIQDRIISMPSQVIVHFDGKGHPSSAGNGYPRVAREVFILGFPKGLSAQGALPIWKRGSVASEPLFPALDGDPVILVDSVTRDGMSGSPVIYFGEEIIDTSGRAHEVNPRSAWLIGVYAGREGVTREEVDMALGRTWRRELLDEIFFQQLPGNPLNSVPEKAS